MTGKVVELNSLLEKDRLGCDIAGYWTTWNTLKQAHTAEVAEVRKYVYATDTTQTTNANLPWKNKTTLPKLCQIRDNLNANYMMAIFPKRKHIHWDANEVSANSREKREAIINYMSWVVGQEQFKVEVQKLVLDYIDDGNAFGTVEWVDQRQSLSEPPVKTGYVGPMIRRISPNDIVFNPTAPSFIEAPKIIRSLMTVGEVKKYLESQSNDENRQAYEDLFKYLTDVRAEVRNNQGADLQVQDAYFQMDGFTSYRAYLESGYVEILTFYGDMYDYDTKEFYPNHKIMVVDRHKVLSKEPNPSYFGFPPIFHVGWRPRQDNLWAMGPLANLVGLQYRLDHVENLKADVFDLLTFPPLKITGNVDDFTWGPWEKIFVGEEGNVEILAPPFQILQANQEIAYLMGLMEEMAGSPREAMGFRTPGEKTAYEVQRLENAAARIFLNKIIQMEELEERLLNACLELARRNMDGVQAIPVFDDEFKIQVFVSLTPQDIVGAGRLKPVAARHFAEKAELIQNMTNFYSSGPGQDLEIRQHMSSIKMAEMFEEALDLSQWRIVLPYVRISEQADAQRLIQAAQEQVGMENQTPAGLTPDDYDETHGPVPQVPMMEPA